MPLLRSDAANNEGVGFIQAMAIDIISGMRDASGGAKGGGGVLQKQVNKDVIRES